ncbi:glutamine--tRNA ligase/YqeY domain fusion protein [Gammaproteobacteria bacterium]|jgi:glutaminyl-tRNA synthetase|nr:glutamine--tRNA ligase/YqeY domain fusion protein [Gammaproteobacteria bacterium]
MSENSNSEPSNFIRNIINNDLKDHKNDSYIHTRFPPEPNGYLHIGHAKSICLNFGIAKDYQGGICNLRFDDTNPEKEDVEYTDSIQNDVKWLGFEWADRLFYASDYYEKLFEFAKQLISDEKAYVCHLNADEVREYRGTLTEPGKASPYRERSVEENLDLFDRMHAGEFDEGECLLRAKIDMISPNMNMRDPAIYRIKKVAHHRTGNDWCIYPMYDYTHCVSDALEGITHSLCTLEFEDHRPLYDWFLEQLPVPCHPQQIEFARLNLNYTVTSKRKLNELVMDGHVSGWDDPRMPTIVGMRRRGYTPESIRDFCGRIGVTKTDTVIDVGVLENCVREDLDKRTRRVLGVLDPLKVVIDNYPDNKTESLDAPYHPNNSDMGQRQLPFSKFLYIEKSDFMEDPPRKFFRLGPGREVRLRYAYFITCNEVIKDDVGNIVELHCTYDPETKGGDSPDGRKVKGTIHWVSVEHALQTEVRLYDRLFNDPKPDSNKHQQDWKGFLNTDSIKVIKEAHLEPSLASVQKEDIFQFERTGYFCVDSKDQVNGKPVFNRTVTLRDSWAKRK